MEFVPPGGDLLVSCSRDQTIKLWDTTSGFCLQTLREGHSDWIRKVALNAKGTLLASSSKDETVVVWNMERVKREPAEALLAVLREHTNQVDCIRWAPLDANHTIDQAEYNKGYQQGTLPEGKAEAD